MSDCGEASVTDWLREYAELGFALFPCDSQKRPLVSRGCLAATDKMAQLTAWFVRGFPQAQIGLATGDASRIVVVDCDTKNNVDGVRNYKNLTGSRKLPTTPTASTPSGGLHFLYRLPPNVCVKNSASVLAPNVDVRGHHGYVVLPPARGRRWLDGRDPWSLEFAPLPAFVPTIDEPPPGPIAGTALPEPIVHNDGTCTSAYGGRAVMRACAAIENAGNGQQEMVLNRECFGIGQLVAGGEIGHGVALQCLALAAGKMPSYDARRPWTPRELSQKLQRAFEQGLRSPRKAAA
jgi:hypothetical protein